MASVLSRRLGSSLTTLLQSKTLLAKQLSLTQAAVRSVAVSGVDSNIQFIDFNDAVEIAQRKTKWELMRSIIILKLCSYDFFVKHCLSMMTISKNLMGTKLWTWMMKSTFYKHFVGGENKQEMDNSIQSLRKASILPMVAVSIEEPIGVIPDYRALYTKNADAVFNCVRIAIDNATTDKLLMLLKITALMPSHVLEDLGRQWYEETKGDLYKIPANLVENVATAIKTGQHGKLSMKDKGMMDSYVLGLDSLEKTISTANSNNLHVLIDAEYTHINQGLSVCALALGLCYNQHRAVTYNTYQCYLKSTAKRFQSELDFIRGNGLHFGAKIVRGAYLNWESENALKKGFESPLHDTYENTNTTYNQVVHQLITLAKQGRVEGMVASHNETSVRKAIGMMHDLHIPKKGPITFGQIYGMSDNISIILAKNGYKVYKVLSYGTIEETMPFLVRRAQENRLVFSGFRNEGKVLRQAYKLK